MPYVLKEGVYFVPGALNGAILDTNTGNVYSVNEEACQVIMHEKEDEEYWQLLVQQGLTCKNRVPKESPVSQQAPRDLDFVWFEVVTNDCNQSCIHCYANSAPCTYRRNQGLPVPSSRKDSELTHSEWLHVIRDAFSLGCSKCQFIGGEPFLYKGEKEQTLYDLVQCAKDVGYEFIEIFTNGLLLTRERLQWIEELGIHIAISLYSMEATVHDRITQTPGSHVRVLSVIEELVSREIPLRVETVLMKSNEKYVKELQKAKEAWGVGNTSIDVLRPTGRGDRYQIQPSFEYLVRYGLQLEPLFTVDEETLYRNICGNPCLQGQLTITDSGDVLPCIFSRETVLGNIKEVSLIGVIDNPHTKAAWRTTKDDVLVCQDCEYRYICQDCRSLAKAASYPRGEFLTAPPPRCTYNPYTGEWAKGLWVLDEQGNPVYNRTKTERIEKILHEMQSR